MKKVKRSDGCAVTQYLLNEGKHFENGFPSNSPSKTFWSGIASQSLFSLFFLFAAYFSTLNLCTVVSRYVSPGFNKVDGNCGWLGASG